MAYDSILTQIRTILQGITDIGQVHTYLRHLTNQKKFLDLFQVTISGQKQIRGWTITRNGIPRNERIYGAGGWHELQHLFVIRGFLGLEDGTATEQTFQALVDTVVEKLDNAITLNNTVREAGPATVIEIGHREFGEVLCHYTEIHYPVVPYYVKRTYDG